MKRTCLQKNTTCPDFSGNTDEQNKCEFHPAGILFEEQHFDPKEIQQVKRFVRMKKNIVLTVTIILCCTIACCKTDFLNPYDRECADEIWTPQNMVATNTGDEVILTWEKPEDHFDGFLIERSLDDQTWEIIANIDCETRRYSDTNTVIGQNYYRISAIADKNQSGYCYANVVYNKNECQYGTFTDERDEHIYKTIVIGNQTWMAENLAWLPSVAPPSDGSASIPRYYVYDYYGSDIVEARKTVNFLIYGTLYNWPAALNSCPDGWHLPSDKEWTELTDYLIANGFGYGGSGDAIGKSIAASWDWQASDEPGSTGNDLVSNNSSCLSMLPGGYRYQDNTFQSMKVHGDWWSSTEENIDSVYYRCMHYTHNDIRRRFDGFNKTSGISIRCIKD